MHMDYVDIWRTNADFQTSYWYLTWRILLIYVYMALSQSWILLTPSGWQHFTNIYLTHKHAELRIISKMKSVEKEPPKFVPTEGSCLLSSHSTKHIPPGNAINSLGEKTFKILYLYTSSLSEDRNLSLLTTLAAMVVSVSEWVFHFWSWYIEDNWSLKTNVSFTDFIF